MSEQRQVGEPLPCPFCGSFKVAGAKIPHMADSVSSIVCLDCHAKGPDLYFAKKKYTYEEAVKIWNSRHGAARIARLEGALTEFANREWCNCDTTEPKGYKCVRCKARAALADRPGPRGGGD